MSFRDLSLDLFEYHEEGGTTVFRVREVDSQTPGEAEAVTVPADFAARLERLEGRDVAPGELIETGTEIGRLLFPGTVRSLFERSLGTLGEGEQLRVRIRPESPPLATIPWELAYLPAQDVPAAERGAEGFLALDRRVSIVRYELRARPPVLRPLGADEKVRVSALLADPGTAEYPDLDVEEEERRLRGGLAGAENVEVTVYGGGIGDLEHLLAEKPHVFHFAGHGEFVEEMGEELGSVVGRGSLVLVGDGGRPVSLPAGRLANNLRGSGVRLAVLSSCEGARRDDTRSWSGIAPALVRGEIPAVVAMQFTIRDQSAVRFTDAFYRTLAAAETIDAAVAAGRQAIADVAADDDRDWAAPVLYSRTDQPLFPIRVGLTKRHLANALVLATALVIGGTWFYQHLYYGLLETRLARGLAGLSGLALILSYLLSWMVPMLRKLRENALAKFEHWLGRPAATPATITLAVAATAAYLLTSSVYVMADGVDGLETVAVTHGTDTVYRDLSLGRATGSVGRVAFPGRRGVRVFHVTSPPMFDSVRARSHWYWPTIHLSAKRFQALDLPVLRLAPAWGIFPILPPRSETAREPMDLEIMLKGDSLVLSGMHNGTVLIGSNFERLQALQANQSRDLVEQSLRRYHWWEDLPPATRTEWMAGWLSDTVWALPSLRAGDTLVIRIRHRPTGEVLALETVVAPAGSGFIPTVFMDSLQESQ